MIEGMQDPVFGEWRPMIGQVTSSAGAALWNPITSSLTPSTSDLQTALNNAGVSANSGYITVSLADPVTTTTYDTEKATLQSGVKRLEDLIVEEVGDFDRNHWKSAMRNGVVLVLCAIFQGFAVFLLILQEKHVVLMEYKLSKSYGGVTSC